LKCPPLCGRINVILVEHHLIFVLSFFDTLRTRMSKMSTVVDCLLLFEVILECRKMSTVVDCSTFELILECREMSTVVDCSTFEAILECRKMSTVVDCFPFGAILVS
jgi:hypothetical protein